MATMRTVYFCESDHNVWFENYKDADKFDKISAVSQYLNEWLNADYSPEFAREVVEYLANRYTLDERYDYKPEAEEDEHEADAI